MGRSLRWTSCIGSKRRKTRFARSGSGSCGFGRTKASRASRSSRKTSCGSSTPTSQRKLFGRSARSEEHTSELQSRPHLVCRLLLEKKKKPTSSVQHNENKSKTIV